MFNLDYAAILRQLPPELATMLIAMTPIAELRASIPIALGVYKMSVFAAIFWSVIGDIIPVLFIVLYLKPISDFLCKNSKVAQKFFRWWFSNIAKKFSGKYEKYKKLALIIFVGIPLPFTGAWSGSVASFLFDIPPRQAYPLIVLGVLLSAFIVTLASLGIFGAFKIFTP